MMFVIDGRNMNVANNALAAAIKAVLMSAPGLALTSVYAQNAQQPPSQNNDQLQEISVYGQAIHYRPDDQSTATGLNMQIVDAPVSISVITDEMLKADNARSVYDVADLIPGLNQSGEGFGQVDLRLRGQAVTEPRINGINFGTVQFVDSFAQERLEIVRGPATVLYGVTGAFGGEINQVLKKPKGGFHAEVGFKGGDFDSRRWQADVMGAIPGTDDRLKVRVVGAYTNYGLFQNLVVPPNNTNKLLTTAIEFDVTPDTVASLYTYKEDRHFDATDGCPLAVNQATKTLFFPFSIPVDQYYCGNPQQNHATNVDEFEMASLTHKFANSWSANVNVAYGKSNQSLDYVFGFGPAGGFALPAQDIYLYSYLRRVDDTTMTANASIGGKFDLFERTQEFFAAVEYQKEDRVNKTYQSSSLGILNIFQDGGKGILANGRPIPIFGVNPNYSTKSSDSRELRGSVQMLFNVTNRWDVLAGVLVQHTGLTDSDVFTNGNPGTYASSPETDVVKRLGVTYGLVADKGAVLSAAKAYISYAEGFEPNVGVFGASGEPLTAPQKMKSYEVGLKTQWNNSNVDADVAIYRATRNNIPAGIFTQVGTGGTFASVLGGANTYEGVEFELLGEVLPGWNASLNYTFTHNLQQSLLFPQRLAVANVPKHDIGLLNSYEFLGGPLKGLIVGATVVRKIDAALVDNAQTIFREGFNPANQVFISTTVVNFRVAHKGFAGHLQGLEVYGNVGNAFNAKYAYSLNGEPGFTNTVMPPRAISAGVNYKF